MENEKLKRKNVINPFENSGEPLRISVSRKYNVKMFFDEYDMMNSSKLQHKNSFSKIGFDPMKALADLRKLRGGDMQVQAFLMTYDLVLFYLIFFLNNLFVF